VPVLARVGEILSLPHLVGHGTLATSHVGVENRVSVGDNSESAGSLLGLLLLLLGLVSLLGVQVLESLSSGGLVRLLGVINSVSDLDELVVEVTDSSPDGVVDSGHDGLLDDTSSDALDKLVEQVVLGVSDGEGEGVNLSVDRVDSDEGVSSLLDRLELDIDRHTLTGKDNIGDTVVLELGPSGLSSEGESNISDVGLDLRHAQSELVVVSVHRLVELVVRRELEGVVALDADNVGEEVGSRKDEVLDDKVDVGVGELGSGDGNVANLPDEGREENVSDVIPQVRLEGKVTLRVEEQILGESLHVITQSPVEGIVVHSSEEQLDLIGQVLPVVTVLVLEEVLAGLLEVLGLSVRVILEDVSGLEKDSVSVVVKLGPPLRELLVVLGISVDLVKRVLHAIHGLAVGESLE